MSEAARPAPLCPSAQPDWEGAVAIGVVGGTVDEPRITPLERPLPVTPELLQLAEPVTPSEVFRFAAPCLCEGCGHFEGSTCNLAAKIVRMVRPAGDALPACDIRPRCRWFRQEGRDACLRCPLVVTADAHPSPEILVAADPATPVPAAVD